MCSVKKKLLASLLVVILSLSIIPVNVFATTPTVVTDEAGLKTAAQNGGEVTIGDCENDCLMLSEPITVSKDLVVNTNGKSIYFQPGTEEQSVFIVSGATLTINGESESLIQCHGAGSVFRMLGVAGKETELILNKGTYQASCIPTAEENVFVNPKSLIDVECARDAIVPKITVNNGSFSTAVGYASNGKLFSGDSANITIKAGTFSVDSSAYVDSKSFCYKEMYGDVWHVLSIADEFSKGFKSILNEKNELVLNRYKPTAEEGSDMLFDALMMKYYVDPEGMQYDFYQSTYNSEEESIYCSMLDKETGEVIETHKIKLVFEYDVTMKTEVDQLIAKLPKGEDVGGWIEPYYFKVTDMELINYWLTCTETNSETNVNQLINYSDEFKKQIGYKNFSLDTRMGFDGDLCTEAAGDANFKYKDTVYGVVNLGARAEHTFYVPDDAQDVLVAAQKRLDDYLGAGKVKLEESTVPNSSDKCYKTTINNIEHYLLIEKDSSKMVTPTYQNIDVTTDIAVLSDDSSIPLDTMLEVEKLTSGTEYDKIKKAINVEDSVTYDIKLHSDSTDKYVTKLDNGSFEVRIPIPEGWDQDALEVYYVDDKEEVTTYEVTPEELQGVKYAVFLTNHFSAYTLGTVKANTTPTKAPATGDVNGLWVWSMAMLTSGGVTVATITDKRKKR